MHRSPAFDRLVVAGFPVGQFGKGINARLDIESERGLISKPDFDRVVVR